MAFIGNDMFGHGMTHHPSSLMQTGGGQFGSGGFGSSTQKATFGSGMSGASGFGQGFGGSSGSHPGTNPNQPLFHRQNSLLTDMTHSKTDPKPVYVSEFNQSAVRHEDQMYSNMYAKPLEKPKAKPVTVQERRKTLQRQKAVSDDDFSRPPKLSARTRSQSVSMYPSDEPDGLHQPMNMDLAKPLLRRSNTVSDKPNKSKHRFLRPLSIGQKFRKRTDSRSSTSSTEPPRSEPPRSLKYDSDIELNVRSGRARSSSDAPQRTNPDKSDDEQARLILGLMNPPSSPEPEMDNKHTFENPSRAVHLNNRDAPKRDIPNNEIIESPSTVRQRFQDRPLDQDNISLTSGQSVASGRSTPKSVHVITTPSLVRTLTIETPARKQTNFPRRSPNRSPRRSPNRTPRRSPNGSPMRSPNRSPAPVSLNNYKPEVVNTRNHQNYRNDSENSDVYNECENAEEKRKPKTKENTDKRKGKSKPQADKPRACLLSTGYNSDDEASNPNSPRTDFKGKDPFHNYANLEYGLHQDDPFENQYDDSTLCVRKLIDTFNRKAKANADEEAPPSPSLKHVKPEVRDIVAAMSFAQHFGHDHEDEADNNAHPSHINHSPNGVYHERPPEIVIPKFESIVKGQEPNTAESSESGYTSNLQNSPRDFELKAAQYVNSLPNHSELGCEQSAGTELVRNGSQTDSDNESEISEIPCKSGSDTDYHMSEPETLDESVMKILESPSEVVQRIQTQLPVKEKTAIKVIPVENVPVKAKKASIQTAPVPINPKIVHSPNSAFVEKRSSMKNKNRQRSDESETELLHLSASESKTTKLALDTLPNNPPNQRTETILVNTSKPGSPKVTAETRLMPKKSTSFAATIMDLPLLGFRKRRLSSVEQTKCTNYLDSFLHCLNVLLFFSSGAVVGVGIWLILKEFNVNHVAEIFGNNIIQVIMYTAVGGAALALLAAMCLCCGVRRDKFGLGFYASVLVVVVLALGTAAVLCTVFIEKLKGVEFKIQFKDRLVTKYGNSEIDPMDNKLFTESWDRMQQEFECCGAHGNVNDTTSWAVYKKFSAWYKIQPNKVYHFVPESCCAPDADVDVCMGSDHKLYGPPVYGPPMDRGFSAKNPNLNTDGCYKMVSAYLHQLLTITALVTGGLAGLYFVVVMLTWVFCFNRRTDADYDYSSYDYYEDDVFNGEEEEEEEEEEAVETENSATNFVHRDMNSTVDTMPDKRIHETFVKSENSFNDKLNMHEYPNEHFSDVNSATNYTAVEIMPHTPKSAGTIPYYSETPENHINLIERISPKMTDRISPNEIERFSPASEEEAIVRRDRYERSDSRLNQMFTETIEEEDSNFEDSDTEASHDHKLTQSQLKGYFRIKNV